jgi:four helix bundle protein
MNATYKDLEVWQIAMTLVEDCYRTTAQFPPGERFALVDQIRRAAISIPANIAEGACRRQPKVFANHLAIALGSHAELETYVELVRRLRYLPDEDLNRLSERAASTGRLLNGLWRAIRNPKQS